MCSQLCFNHLESENRPTKGQWTEEQQAVHAKRRAKTIMLANARAKAKVNGVYVLVGGNWSAKFDVQGDTVTITHARGRGCYVVAEQPMEMDRMQARVEWLRLIDAGYTMF